MISRRQPDIQTKSVATDACGKVHLQNNSPEVCHQVYIKRKFIEVESTKKKSKKSKSSNSTFHPGKSVYLRLPAYDGSSLLDFVQRQSKSLAAFVSGITQETISKNIQSVNPPITKDSQFRCKTSKCKETKKGVTSPLLDTRTDEKQKCFKSNNNSETGIIKPLLSGCNPATTDLPDTKSHNNDEIISLKPSQSGSNCDTADLLDIKNNKNKNAAKAIMVVKLKKPSLNGFIHGAANFPVNECLKPGFSRNFCTTDSTMNDHSKSDFSCNLCAADLPVNDYSKPNYTQTNAEEYVFKCCHCPGIFSREYDLISHEKIHSIHSMNKPFSCSLCTASFCKQMALKNHLRLHDNKPFKCDHCYASFQSKRSLQRHLYTHDNGKPYGGGVMCSGAQNFDKQSTEELCLADINKKSNLIKETPGHGIAESFICNLCPASCGSKGLLDFHLHDKHNFTHERPSAHISRVQLNIKSDSFAESESLKICETAPLNRSLMVDDEVLFNGGAQQNKASFDKLTELELVSQPIKSENELFEECDLSDQPQAYSGADSVPEIKEGVKGECLILRGNELYEGCDFSGLTQANSGSDMVYEVKGEIPDKDYFLSENELHNVYDLPGKPQANSGVNLASEIEEVPEKSYSLIENEIHDEYNSSRKPGANSVADSVFKIKEEFQNNRYFFIKNELHNDYDLSGEPQTNEKTDLVPEIKVEPQDENDCLSENELHNEYDLSGKLEANLGADLVSEIKEERQDESDKLIQNLHGSTVIKYDIPSLPCNTENISESCSGFNSLCDRVESQPDQFCVISEGKILTFSSSSFEIRKITRADILDSYRSQILAKPRSHQTADQMKVRRVSVMLTDLFPDHVRRLGKAHTNNESCLCIYCTRGGEKSLSPASQLENAEKCQRMKLHSSVLKSEVHSDVETLKLLPLVKTLPSAEQENGPDVNLKEPSNEKPFKCNVCTKTFKCPSFLLKHDSVMHSQNRFTASFPQKTELNKTAALSGKQKAHCCEHCPQTFERQNDLRKHKAGHNHHQILHSCHLCPALFKRIHNLKMHLLIHSRENSKQCRNYGVRKPWLPRFLNCAVCAAVFTNKTSLSTHMLVHLFDKSLNQTSAAQ